MHDPHSRPLVVDLDGTLIHTDTLLESLMVLIKQNPLVVFLLPFWVLKGKAWFKNKIAADVALDARLLPYNHNVLDAIAVARQAGRSVYLATGSVHKFAEGVNEHLKLFDGVFATQSDGSVNFTGRDKAKGLVAQFGEAGFDYMGNSSVDLGVWKHCHTAYVISRGKQLANKASKVARAVETIDAPARSAKTWIKAIRVHQWVKNTLIAVPLFTSHEVTDPQLLVLCVLGIAAFSMAASSVYILNDLLDLESDRQHPSKRERPFASGALPISHGSVLCPFLLLGAFAIASLLPPMFLLSLAVYYVLTVAYSLKLKQVILLDTIMLAGLYTMRIIAGTLLFNIHFSFWLLAFSIFIFLSLALVKRYTELVLMKAKGSDKAIGRGYRADDAPIVAAFGCASGYIAVLVMALYVHSDEVLMLYSRPSLLWFVCLFLLYWISRVWMLAHRGEMHDDPIIFAVKDLQSLATGLIVALVFVLAI